MDIHSAFRRGSEVLAQAQRKYTELHKGHGIDPFDWEVLTQQEYWTPEQARDMRSVIANVLEVAMTIAGMPAIALPGHYVAAMIATVVSPSNRLIACTKVPDTFDAVAASGIHQTFEVKPMRVEQIMSLVLAYSGGFGEEPPAHKLPREVNDMAKEYSKK